MEYLIIATNIIIILMVLFIAHKIRRVHVKIFQVQSDLEHSFTSLLDDHYQQIQALVTLEHTLDLKQHLPALRGWAASPDLLVKIMTHVLEEKPENMVECGSGSTTLVMAKCAEMNGKGHIYSLEHDAIYAEKQRQMLSQAGLSHRVTIIDAPFKEYTIQNKIWKWYDHSSLTDVTFDLIIVDGPPMSVGPMARYPAGPFLFSKLAPSGVVILDDMNRPNDQASLKQWQKDEDTFTVEDKYCEKGCIFLRKK